MEKEIKRTIRSYPLDQSPLYKVGTKKRLAEVLNLSKDKLDLLTKKDNAYSEWDEVNQKGKKRHIEAPCHELKRVQKRIAALLSRITPPHFLFCPVKRRSQITNAKKHVGHTIVRCIDIQEYYVATPSRRIYWFFRNRMRCTKDVAGILAKLLTVNGHLPTGSPSSPILSYFSHIDMWEEISGIVHETGCVLTVYMDDITISGENVPPHLMWRVRRQIRRCGLRYHKEKGYFGKKFAEVTGIIIKGGKLSLPHRHYLKKHQLRQGLAKASNSEEKEKIMQQLRGCDAYAQQVKLLNEV